MVFMPTRSARSYTQLITGSEVVTYSMSPAQGTVSDPRNRHGIPTFRNTIGFISDPRNRHGISNVQTHDPAYS